MLKVDHIEWVKMLDLEKIKYPLMISGMPSLELKELLQMGFKMKNLELYSHHNARDSYGPLALKQELAKYYNVKVANIAMCAGANMAIYLLCAGLLKSGDEIILESPCYEPMRRSAQSLGAKIVPLHRRIENNWQPDPAELDRLITRKTKLIFLTDLHNPSGVKMDEAVIRGLVKVAEKHHVYIACDEVYKDFLFVERDDQKFSSQTRLRRDQPRRPFCKTSPMAITLSSLTKVYGLGLMRTGWIMASPELAYLFSRTYDYMSAVDSYPAQMISLYCMRHIGALIKRTKEIVGNKRQIIKDWIATEPRLKWVEPAGGIVCFIKLPFKDSFKFQKHLFQRYQTSVVPGEYFGTPGYIRIASGTKPHLLKQGLKNISLALKKFS
ncbi:MAG: aminotransferase class I/II-fold pyridoxal phosphate-dependent enzyme [Planctomycetes bacterium]|nr:aminotransferase class I/II-fold pyridoxal phosphate-dependent enzyme [Planctomycetota bacterium]